MPEEVTNNDAQHEVVLTRQRPEAQLSFRCEGDLSSLTPGCDIGFVMPELSPGMLSSVPEGMVVEIASFTLLPPQGEPLVATLRATRRGGALGVTWSATCAPDNRGCWFTNRAPGRYRLAIRQLLDAQMLTFSFWLVWA